MRSPANLIDIAARHPPEERFPATDPIVGECASTRTVAEQVTIVSPTDSTVLILGESGTGKSRIAAWIHDQSARRNRAFVKVSCAAIPSRLLESELFGHERGAFTGAISQRIGRFEVADGGTLFLDEVGDIPQESQPKLLRLLQEHEFERLGNARTLRTNVRLIAATHRDLKQMILKGSFRADLFYRLNVFPITLPRMRERRDDIPRLVRHFVKRYSDRLNRRIEIIPTDIMEALTAHPSPGNVREIENFIERSVILSRGSALEAPLADLAPVEQEGAAPVTLKDAERAHIRRILSESNGVTATAAARLGIPRSTLFYKIRRLRIAPARERRAIPRRAAGL